MLQRLTNAVEGKEIKVNPPVAAKRTRVSDASSTPLVGKYQKLYDYFRTLDDLSVTPSMSEIEEIVSFALPASANNHRVWWANDITHSQAKAWLLADWKVDAVSLPTIAFRKIHN